jgi:hypothetical protein
LGILELSDLPTDCESFETGSNKLAPHRQCESQ